MAKTLQKKQDNLLKYDKCNLEDLDKLRKMLNLRIQFMEQAKSSFRKEHRAVCKWINFLKAHKFKTPDEIAKFMDAKVKDWSKTNRFYITKDYFNTKNNDSGKSKK